MRYEQTNLSSGASVVTTEMRQRDSLAMAIWVRVGGRYESKRRSGASHFLEHMLFKGTKRRSTKQIKQGIEGIGGSFNAFTGEESTCYYVKIPKQHQSQSFDILQDMINHSLLDPQEFDREKTVILEEIKMYLDLPQHHVHEVMGEILWPDQALGRPIAGTLHSVSALTRDDLAVHYRQYYHPKNILITACGEIDHDQFVKSSRRNFLRCSTKAKASNFEKARHRRGGTRSRFIDKKTEQTHFVLGFHGLSRWDAKRYALSLLSIILGGNMSSRLFEEVREKRGLAYEIKSGLSYFEDTGAIAVSAGVEPKKAASAVDVILKEVDKLRRGRVSPAEMRRAKEYYLGQLMLGLEDPLDRMLWFGEQAIYGGPLQTMEAIRQKVLSVSPSDIRQMAKRIFTQTGIHLSLIGPLGQINQKKIRQACRLHE